MLGGFIDCSLFRKAWKTSLTFLVECHSFLLLDPSLLPGLISSLVAERERIKSLKKQN